MGPSFKCGHDEYGCDTDADCEDGHECTGSGTDRKCVDIDECTDPRCCRGYNAVWLAAVLQVLCRHPGLLRQPHHLPEQPRQLQLSLRRGIPGDKEYYDEDEELMNLFLPSPSWLTWAAVTSTSVQRQGGMRRSGTTAGV